MPNYDGALHPRTEPQNKGGAVPLFRFLLHHHPPAIRNLKTLNQTTGRHSPCPPTGPAKLLHVSDLHAHRPWFDWVALEAEQNHWSVALTGDLLNIDRQADFAEMRRQTKWIGEWVQAARFPLFICSGNHDHLPYEKDAGWLRALARPGVTVDGQRGIIGGFNVVCLPWTSGPETFLQPDVLAADIWLHHAPPSECEIARTADGCDWGSGDLSSALTPVWQARVRLVLSGHVHASHHWHTTIGDTLCLNTAPLDFSASIPKHIRIYLHAGHAELRETAANERIKLRPWSP